MPTLLRRRPVALGVTVLLGSVPVAVPPRAHSPATVLPAAVSPATVPPGPTPSAAVPARSFRWPLDGTPQVRRRFEPPPQPWLPGHRGVDLAAAPGAPVRAAGAGVVLFAGMVAGRPVVTVGHADGLRTTYEPVLPRVRAGDPVTAGAQLGTLLAGHRGCPPPACLHWGLRRATEYLDPLALLGLGPVRLLPLSGTSPRRSGAPDTAGRRRASPRAHGRASSGGRRTARRSYSSAVL